MTSSAILDFPSFDYFAGRPPADIRVQRRSDLLAQGLTDIDIRVQVRRGQLTRIRHGIYADAISLAGADPEALHLAHLRAALLAATEPALAVGPSAALLHGMPIGRKALTDLHIARESDQDPRSLRRPSKHRLELPPTVIVTHQNASLGATSLREIPVVSRSVAAVTSAHLVSFSRRVGLLDSVLWSPGVSADDLRELAREWQHLGGLDMVIDALAYARRGAQTYLETLSRLTLVRLGLPEPELQVPFYDKDGLIGFADMYWPTLNVIGEADGAVKYGGQRDIVKEKRRESRLRAKGHGVVRWMQPDILERPQQIVEQVRREGRRAA